MFREITPASARKPLVPKMALAYRKSALVGCLIFVLVQFELGTCQSHSWKGFTFTCSKEDPQNSSVSCHGVRIVRRIVQQLLESSSKKVDIEIVEGVHLIGKSRGSRMAKGFGAIDPLVEFLQGRELRLKLPSLVGGNLEAALQESLPALGQARKSSGLGGGKKGDGGVLLMALMMGKMMAALGFGSLALLVLKALMVSGLALMLSLIVAVKKLTSKEDDGGHHVVYAQEVGHHHRRKREILDQDFSSLPYRGYVDLYSKGLIS